LLNNPVPDNTYSDGGHIYLILPSNFRYPSVPNFQTTSLIKFNYQGDTLWTKQVSLSDTNWSVRVVGIHKAHDNTLLLTGYKEPLNRATHPYLLTQTLVDFDGNILSYNEITSPLLDYVYINNSVYRNDTIFYAVSKPRNYYQNNGQSSIYINQETVMIATDTSGTILASNTVYSATDTLTYSNNTTHIEIKEMPDGSFLLIGGQTLGPNTYVASITNVKPDLTVNWVRNLDNINSDSQVYEILICDTVIRLFGIVGDFETFLHPNNSFIYDMNLNGDSIGYIEKDLLPYGYSEMFWDAEVNSNGDIICSYQTYWDDNTVPHTITFGISKIEPLAGCEYVPLSIKEEKPQVIKNSLFSFYPNPAIDDITLTNTSNEKTSYCLINQYGSLVDSFTLNPYSTTTLSINKHAQGLYYLYAITTGGKVQTEKLVH
jgi:hypothetical protein